MKIKIGPTSVTPKMSAHCEHNENCEVVYASGNLSPSSHFWIKRSDMETLPVLGVPCENDACYNAKVALEIDFCWTEITLTLRVFPPEPSSVHTLQCSHCCI